MHRCCPTRALLVVVAQVRLRGWRAAAAAAAPTRGGHRWSRSAGGRPCDSTGGTFAVRTAGSPCCCTRSPCSHTPPLHWTYVGSHATRGQRHTTNSRRAAQKKKRTGTFCRRVQLRLLLERHLAALFPALGPVEDGAELGDACVDPRARGRVQAERLGRLARRRRRQDRDEAVVLVHLALRGLVLPSRGCRRRRYCGVALGPDTCFGRCRTVLPGKWEGEGHVVEASRSAAVTMRTRIRRSRRVPYAAMAARWRASLRAQMAATSGVGMARTYGCPRQYGTLLYPWESGERAGKRGGREGGRAGGRAQGKAQGRAGSGRAKGACEESVQLRLCCPCASGCYAPSAAGIPSASGTSSSRSVPACWRAARAASSVSRTISVAVYMASIDPACAMSGRSSRWFHSLCTAQEHRVRVDIHGNARVRARVSLRVRVGAGRAQDGGAGSLAGKTAANVRVVEHLEEVALDERERRRVLSDEVQVLERNVHAARVGVGEQRRVVQIGLW